MVLKVKKLRESAQLPKMATAGSAGYDLYSAADTEILLLPGETRLVPTGLAMEILQGYAGFVFARSGLGIKSGIVPANCVGVIDSDYRGEVQIGLRNQSHQAFVVHPGDRVAQLVLLPVSTPAVELCETLSETARAAEGFGSTGR